MLIKVDQMPRFHSMVKPTKEKKRTDILLNFVMIWFRQGKVKNNNKKTAHHRITANLDINMVEYMQI